MSANTNTARDPEARDSEGVASSGEACILADSDCGWTECSDFVGADPAQIRVYAGSGDEWLIQTVNGCNCAGLAYALLDHLDKPPVGWSWSLDLAALRTCDVHFLSILIAVGNHLRRAGGRLAIAGLERVPMPPPVRSSLLKDCETHGIVVNP